MAAGHLIIPGWMPALDANANPLPGARLTFFAEGTTDLATVYADADLETPLANPVVANGSGQFVSIFGDTANAYDVKVETTAEVQLDYVLAVRAIGEGGSDNDKADRDAGNLGSEDIAAWQIALNVGGSGDPNVFRPEDYKTSGNTWDEAIQDMYDAAHDGAEFQFRSDTYLIDGPLSFTLWQNATFNGQSGTVIRYRGSDADLDIITIGSSGTQLRGQLFQNIRVQSDTEMTDGWAYKVTNVTESRFVAFRPDNEEGTGGLYNGAWFDGVDYNSVNDLGEVSVPGVAVRTNGTVGPGPKAGFQLGGAKLSGDIGWHIAGGFGGTYPIGMLDCINCRVPLLIDDSIVAEPNREVMLSSTCSFDGGEEAGIQVDQGNANFFLNLGGAWASSTSNGPGVHLKRCPNAYVVGDVFAYNNQGSNGHGVWNEESAAIGNINVSSRLNAGWGAADTADGGSGISSGVHFAVVDHGSTAGALYQPLLVYGRKAMGRLQVRGLQATGTIGVGTSESDVRYVMALADDGNPVLGFDTGDFLKFDRSANQLRLEAPGNAQVWALQEGGMIFPANTGSLNPTIPGQMSFYRINDTSVRFVMVGSDTVVRKFDMNLTTI